MDVRGADCILGDLKEMTVAGRFADSERLGEIKAPMAKFSDKIC